MIQKYGVVTIETNNVYIEGFDFRAKTGDKMLPEEYDSQAEALIWAKNIIENKLLQIEKQKHNGMCEKALFIGSVGIVPNIILQ